MACNLYPFVKTVEKPDVKVEEAVEQIDIGQSVCKCYSVCVCVCVHGVCVCVPVNVCVCVCVLEKLGSERACVCVRVLACLLAAFV